MQLYIDTIHTKLSVKNGTFLISNESTKRLISPRRVSSIAILTNVLINSAAIKLAAKSEIPIVYFDQMGNLLAQLSGPSYLQQSRLRHAQMKFMHSEKGRNWVLQQLVLKTELQLQTLELHEPRLTKLKSKWKELFESIEMKKEALKSINNHQPISSSSLMGIEGGIARLYFRAVNCILPEVYCFERRSRRPGKDYFNASLNYLYGMTYGEITRSIHAAGLDTFVGGLHSTTHKENLVFDCIEVFRPLIDRLLIDLCLKESLQDHHFKTVKDGFWLSREGKRMIIEHFNQYMHRRISFAGKVRSIRRHMYAQVEDLKKQIHECTRHVSNHL
ncbi:MAG: CRISPR-associated endonuclease Cas1 [Flavobacteriales bacterium]|nr:CRISPR-associated endonuclease Cas1 [Flavobacteriales bacterium]